MGFIVGIDGTAGSGKGTVTKNISNKLGLINVDTGSTYRCVALAALRANAIKDDIIDEKKVIELLDSISIEIENTPLGDKIYLNGEDVTTKIREKDVTKVVSPVSSIKEVRFKMVDLQRKLAEGKDVIMEGRDICTYVFPNADVKIYLDASEEERARRRLLEMQEKGIDITYEEVLDNIRKRDYNDKHKEIGALKLAPDSIVIEMATQELQIKRGSSSKWKELNPVLAAGEPGYVLDENKLKIGDGVTAWNDLSYIGDNEVVNKPTHYDFPSIGNPNTIYKAEQEQKIYQWNSTLLKYELIGTDTGGVLDIDLIDGGNANGNS